MPDSAAQETSSQQFAGRLRASERSLHFGKLVTSCGGLAAPQPWRSIPSGKSQFLRARLMGFEAGSERLALIGYRSGDLKMGFG